MGWLRRLLFGELADRLDEIDERLKGIEEAITDLDQGDKHVRIIVIPTGVEHR